MFGIIGKVIDAGLNEASEFVENPVGKTVRVVTQPVRDGLEILGGLTEGEFRLRAAARLGVDVVSGMALGEIIEALSEIDV